MARFIITCEHAAEECEELDRELQAVGVAEVMKGRDFFCACPYGHHGGWVAVESESVETIQALLPPAFGSHAKVYPVEVTQFT